MTEYSRVFQLYEENADAEKAAGMRAYMRNQFPFLGLTAPVRKNLSKDFLKAAADKGLADWGFVDLCWKKSPREFQYLAVGYLDAVKDSLGPPDLPRLKRLAVTKSWWDTIDGLDRIVGHVAHNHREINSILLKWSLDDNIWLRRIAIDHQLARREKTDTALLRQILINNLGQKEFFVNKAIGWSLREYGKTNPEWVRLFIDEFRNRLASLSIREGSKYILAKTPGNP
ncbi:MAG: DNA alkylation repair protein [Deltaproteobacteria bacterium]|jgi:3-methyladenine DNA glycosylase AlkD|nr:DNA alkylation repair protein [Deltaproteobacteria bacterium]